MRLFTKMFLSKQPLVGVYDLFNVFHKVTNILHWLKENNLVSHFLVTLWLKLNVCICSGAGN